MYCCEMRMKIWCRWRRRRRWWWWIYLSKIKKKKRLPSEENMKRKGKERIGGDLDEPKNRQEDEMFLFAFVKSSEKERKRRRFFLFSARPKIEDGFPFYKGYKWCPLLPWEMYQFLGGLFSHFSFLWCDWRVIMYDENEVDQLGYNAPRQPRALFFNFRE